MLKGSKVQRWQGYVINLKLLSPPRDVAAKYNAYKMGVLWDLNNKSVCGGLTCLSEKTIHSVFVGLIITSHSRTQSRILTYMCVRESKIVLILNDTFQGSFSESVMTKKVTDY